MFKGIYYEYSESLQYSAVKIIPIVSKNRAQQSYLILNYVGFCEFFSQNARNIHAESVAIWKFVHKCTKFGYTRHSGNKFRSALVGTSSRAADVECYRRRRRKLFVIIIASIPL